MKRALPLAVVVLLAVTGCGGGTGSSGTGGAATTGSGAQTSSSAAAGNGSGGGAQADAACSGGLTGKEPGVVRITCDGTAVIRVRVAGTSKDFHGGVCRSAGEVWSVGAGVVIDATGTHGSYTGPAVDSVAVNNTSTAGKGTIQVALAGKHYFDLGGAAMTLSADKKTAHLDGTGDRLSDGPGQKITVDVTC
jgi:hypothetical protein